jgi:hypothetical protein
VQQWHRTGHNPAFEPVTHNDVGAVAQVLDEWRERGKVIGIVGIAHDHITATRRLDASDQRRAIAAIGNRHDAHACLLRDRL